MNGYFKNRDGTLIEIVDVSARSLAIPFNVTGSILTIDPYGYGYFASNDLSKTELEIKNAIDSGKTVYLTLTNNYSGNNKMEILSDKSYTDDSIYLDVNNSIVYSEENATYSVVKKHDFYKFLDTTQKITITKYHNLENGAIQYIGETIFPSCEDITSTKYILSDMSIDSVTHQITKVYGTNDLVTIQFKEDNRVEFNYIPLLKQSMDFNYYVKDTSIIKSIKNDISKIQNTGVSKATTGKVWMATEYGAEWKDISEEQAEINEKVNSNYVEYTEYFIPRSWI